jgi:hypothetical protein
MTLQNFFTIRADVKLSKQNKKYRDLQKITKDVNDELFLIYKNNQATLIEMTVRAGDELFSIYRSLDAALDAFQLLLISAKKYKVPLSIGCGFGRLDDESDNANLVNGVSIWRATEALEKVKRGLPKYNEKLEGNIGLKIDFSNDKNINKLHQILFFLLSEKVLKRTKQQNKAVLLFKQHPQKEYHELYDLLTNYEDNTSTKDEKRIKYSKFLQRAEYHIVNDLIDLIKNNF